MKIRKLQRNVAIFKMEENSEKFSKYIIMVNILNF